MWRSTLAILVFGVVLGIAIGLMVNPLRRTDEHGQVAIWLEIVHRVTTAVGGLGTFEGPVLGALVLFGIQQEFSDSASWYLVGLGAVAIAVTLVLPRGLWGALVDRFGIRLVPVGYTLRGLLAHTAGQPEPERPVPHMTTT